MMKKINLLLVFSLSLSALAAQQQDSRTQNAKIARVENSLSGGLVIDGKLYSIAERMKQYKVAGLSVAVIDSGRIVWAKGYGYADKKEGRKLTVNTLFEPGSISKSLNALGILYLAQQGKLDLYQDINQYLSSWKFPYDSVSNGKKITTAQLLSHTAGLGVHGFPGYPRNGAIATVIDILDGRPPSNTEPVRSIIEPGKEPRYSGGGTLISQQLLMDITRQSYEQFMLEQVLRPLGMKNSSYSQPPAARLKKSLATGYKTDGSEVPGKYFVYPEKAAAGLWTTPLDICKYIIEMQQVYQGKKGKLLNQEMVKLHVTPYKNNYSMGSFQQIRDGELYFEHTASNEGFSGLFMGGLTNGKGVAIFVNSDDATIAFELLNSIALEYNWKGFRKPEEITTITLPDSIALKYVGEYINAGYYSQIKKEKDGLYFWTDGLNSKMHFTSPTNFRNVELGGNKRFLFNNDGTVSGYTNTINGKVRATGKKITALDTVEPRPGQSGILGRHLLEIKTFDRAIVFLSKGLELEPSEPSLIRNLAHAYLFKGDFNQAIELYKKFLASPDSKKVLKDDFEYLRKAGFEEKEMKRVGELLGLGD